MDKTNSIVGSKRRNYFIDKNFQTRFILKYCFLLAIGGLLTIAIVYLLATQSTTVAFLNSRVVVRTTADFILPILIQAMLLVAIIIGLVTIAMTLLASHKIVGPLYRFKKIMEILGEGDFSKEFKIRRLDQLQDVADAFNAMIVKVKGELKKLKDNFQNLKDRLDGISESEISEHKRAYLGEIKKISQELNRIISYFKT